MQRPLGVTILALLAALGGVFAILGGLLLVGISSAVSFALPIAGLTALIGLAVVALGVGELIFAYGAWTLKPWAWTLGVGLEVANIVLQILQFRSDAASNILFSVVISGIILWYLFRPEVRRAFGQNV